MARPIDGVIAKRIIQAHKSLLADLSMAANLRNTLRQEIINASNKMVAQEALQVLKEIPIEEINRDKRGFRIKALKDHGYHTIADISTASVYSIASIYGISEDTAYSIKGVVKDIIAKETTLFTDFLLQRFGRVPRTAYKPRLTKPSLGIKKAPYAGIAPHTAP